MMWWSRLLLLLCFPLDSAAFDTVQEIPRQGVSLYARSSSRSNRISSLLEWSELQQVERSKSYVELKSDPMKGLGWFASQIIPANQILLSVPTSATLAVNEDEKIPWYVQMSILLNKLDATYQPWKDSLPRQLDTPLHWNDAQLQELQYDPMAKAVPRQARQWMQYHQQCASMLTYDDFVWGCEMGRSRAFSGYSGNAFSPYPYAFLLLLVTLYVGLNLGSLEQAANGAGIVLSVNILRDFVVPKFWKQQRYVICPTIDMVNHQGRDHQCRVSFEYFSDAYSLASESVLQKGDELYISYGARSNDQLLQYYGFVEINNPHDVYVMPPLREWNVHELEQATSRTVAPGRLQKLDRAGLLGGNTNVEDGVSNPTGGVVVTRATGLDPAILQALRALLSTDAEWSQASEAVGNFAAPVSPENETAARTAARTAMEAELASKATTVEQDERLLRTATKTMEAAERLALLFRVEKKKLLQETIDSLQ